MGRNDRPTKPIGVSMKKEIPDGYVRVTELLSPYSGLQGIDPIVLQKAADRGQRVHNYCELYAQSLLIDQPDAECQGYVESFKRWFDSTVDKVISLEQRLYHHGYKVTGKYDMIVLFKGSPSPVLVDIKTPANVGKTWGLQTAAYQWMHDTDFTNGFFIMRRGCLMVDKHGKNAAFKEYGNENDREIFLSILKTYRYFNP